MKYEKLLFVFGMPFTTYNIEDECARLRKIMRLTDKPSQAEGKHDAGVLILLDAVEPGNYSVFLTVRSENLRRHPGEVCFPGGMPEKTDRDLRHTAMREAEEEVGLLSEDYIILGSLPSFRARFGILIHPTVALLKRPFTPRLNHEEVQKTFWKPLVDFLDDSLHMGMEIEPKYSVHSFSFDVAHTYGVTALMCIVVAMAALQRFPAFDLSPIITTVDYAGITVNMAVDRVFDNANIKFLNAKL